MSKTHDIIIIGQGLAGSLLAYELSKQGEDILVLDDGLNTSSSKVAAGIINPITGHRPNRDPLYDIYLEKALLTYKALEADFGQDFIRPQKQIRIFQDQKQKTAWLEKYMATNQVIEINHKRFPELKLDHGGCLVAFSYVVDVASVLSNIQNYLIQKNQYQQRVIEHKDIHIHPTSVSIDQHHAKQIVFCEGARIQQNPLFKDVEMVPAKGEILTLDIPALAPNFYNWGKWLVPTHDGKFRLGSNHIWDDQSMDVSQETKVSLLESMQSQFAQSLEFRVIDHISGIRPATKDRNPVVQKSTKHDHIFCFNGFGSKGCLMIPFYVQEFIHPAG